MFEIGNSLREARVRQGLEYPQIELATKIRAKYIRALEDEQFDDPPGHTYVKGFLRTYAEFLGLDGQLYVDEFNSRFVGDGIEDAPRRVAPRVHQDRGIERKVLVLALAGIAVLTALVIVAWKFGGERLRHAVGRHAAVVDAEGPVATRPAADGREARHVRRGAPQLGRPAPCCSRRRSARGKIERIDGQRFWLYVRRSSGVRVSLGGKAVSLPAGRNLKVLVTPTRTARAAT